MNIKILHKTAHAPNLQKKKEFMCVLEQQVLCKVFVFKFFSFYIDSAIKSENSVYN